MDVIGGVGVGSQPLIVYKTDKQHPECRASTAADAGTSAAVRLAPWSRSSPGGGLQLCGEFAGVAACSFLRLTGRLSFNRLISPNKTQTL